MMDYVVGGIVRGSHIVIAVTDPNFQKRIFYHCTPKCFRYIKVFLPAIAPGLYAAGEYLVRNIILIFSLAADIVIDSRGVSTINCDIIAGIIIKIFTGLIIVLPGDPGIQTTNGLFFFSQ